MLPPVDYEKILEQLKIHEILAEQYKKLGLNQKDAEAHAQRTIDKSINNVKSVMTSYELKQALKANSDN